MELLQAIVIAAALLCALVAGFLFAFAVVVMPGIRSLGDREFIRAFQVIDRVIQNTQPIFVVVWVGSVLTLVAAAVVGLGQLEGVDRAVLIISTFAYLFGVQLPTVAINVPLNNTLQALDIAVTDAHQQRVARQDFEPRWNRWNVVRTIIASLVSAGLLVLLVRL